MNVVFAGKTICSVHKTAKKRQMVEEDFRQMLDGITGKPQPQDLPPKPVNHSVQFYHKMKANVDLSYSSKEDSKKTIEIGKIEINKTF